MVGAVNATSVVSADAKSSGKFMSITLVHYFHTKVCSVKNVTPCRNDLTVYIYN